MDKCILRTCEEPALDGDCVCAGHRDWYRGRHVRRCSLCERKLIGFHSLETGQCFPSCEERKKDEAIAQALRKRASKQRGSDARSSPVSTTSCEPSS